MVSATTHTPVLLREAADALVHNRGGHYVDGTFGRGGHSRAILAQLNPEGRLTAYDKDPQAVAHAQTTVDDTRFCIRHASFTEMRELPARSVDGVLLDLGVSSPQIDTPQRGFSFRHDGPLDMRMDTTRGQSAADWLATADTQQIAEVIRDYGEERFATPLQRRLLLAGKSGVPSQAHPNWPSSWLARSKPASRVRTLQRAHFRLFGFSSTPNLKNSSRHSTPRS